MLPFSRGGLAEPADAGPPHWHKLIVGQGYNPVVREASRGSGVYAIKNASTGRVLYVGHSHTGRLWKTMLRHLQAPDSFERVGDWVYRGSMRDLTVSVWPTPAQDAGELEDEMIARLEPEANLERMVDVEDDEVPF